MKTIYILITTLFLHQVSFGQGFVPATPDTAKLKSLEQQGSYGESLGYLYLMKYYKPISEKDSIIYSEWESNAICSFKQEFEGNIEYEVWHCKEAGGISERLVFPRMENHTAKEFVLKLFYDKWNSWVSEFKYEPDGAGCYFEIEHSENQTSIDVYCGC